MGASTSRVERDFDDAASVGDIIIENDPGDVPPSGGSLLGNVSAVVVGDAPSQQAGGGLMEDDRQSTHSDQEEPPPQDEGKRTLRKKTQNNTAFSLTNTKVLRNSCSDVRVHVVTSAPCDV